MSIRAVVWNEFIHEREDADVREIYPDGIHATIASALSVDPAITATTATLDQPEHGLSQARLDETDVLLWWGHKAHGSVSDEVVRRVQQRVWEGMGLIVLHSGHFSKIFKAMMGSPCSLRWREAGERERVWAINPSHPIAQGIGPSIVIENSEMYGEPFLLPEPVSKHSLDLLPVRAVMHTNDRHPRLDRPPIQRAVPDRDTGNIRDRIATAGGKHPDPRH